MIIVIDIVIVIIEFVNIVIVITIEFVNIIFFSPGVSPGHTLVLLTNKNRATRIARWTEPIGSALACEPGRAFSGDMKTT